MPVAQFGEDWHDERLMEALTRACQVIPRHPADAPSSAPSILERWRARVGIAVSAEAVQQSAAWEVHSHHATCSSCLFMHSVLAPVTLDSGALSGVMPGVAPSRSNADHVSLVQGRRPANWSFA